MNNSKEFLGTEPIGKLLFKLAVPSVIAQIVNMLYNIVDRIYIGHIPGSGSLALTGVGVCLPIIMVVSAFAALVGSGGAPRASIFMGKDDMDSAEKILSGCFTVQIIISAILTAVLLLFGRSMLLTFGASENTIGYAVDYMSIYAVGTIFVQMTLGMNMFITAQGFSKTSMLTVTIGAVCNIILDPLLIFGIGPFPKMGIAGAALATGIGQMVPVIFYLIVYFVSPIPVRLRSGCLKPDAKMALQLYSIGVPAILNLALPSVLITFLNSLLAVYSQSYVVVLGIYYKLQTFLYLPANGIVQGLRPIIGYNYGAGEYDRVKKLYRTSMGMCAAIMAAGTVLCLALSGQLIGLFSSNAETIAIGTSALRIICVGFIVSTISVVASGSLEGLGMGVQSLVISLCRYIVVIMPLAWLFCRLLGADGIWNAFWVTEVITAGISMVVYHKSVKLK